MSREAFSIINKMMMINSSLTDLNVNGESLKMYTKRTYMHAYICMYVLYCVHLYTGLCTQETIFIKARKYHIRERWDVHTYARAYMHAIHTCMHTYVCTFCICAGVLNCQAFSNVRVCKDVLEYCETLGVKRLH